MKTTLKQLFTWLLVLTAAVVFLDFQYHLQEARETQVMLKSYPYNHSKIPNR